MRWNVLALGLCAALGIACTEEKKPEPPPVAKVEPKKTVEQPVAPAVPEQPPKILEVKAKLAEKGIAVTDLKKLAGTTMPGCKEEYRSRVYLGSEMDFVNVVKLGSAEDAKACLELYKAAVLKGGQPAWDRLGPLISTNSHWLYLFSESMTDPARRDAVLAEVKKVE